MRISKPVVTTLFWLTLAGAILHGDAPGKKTLASRFNPTTTSAGTKPGPKPKPPPPAEPPTGEFTITDAELRTCQEISQRAALLGVNAGLFESHAWKDFVKLFDALDERELVTFSAIESIGNSFRCNLALYSFREPMAPFRNHREIFIYRVFCRIFGANQLHASAFSSGRMHWDEKQEALQRDIGIFKRLSRQTDIDLGVYIFYDHLAFMYISKGYKGFQGTRTDKIQRGFGKWEITFSSLEAATKTIEQLLPYFKSGELDLLKFDLQPLTTRVSTGPVWRIIVYTSDHNPKAKRILRNFSSQIFWVYEEQTTEGAILGYALDKFSSGNPSDQVAPSLQQEVLAQLKDKDSLLSLGLTLFQYDVLKEISRIASNKNATINLGNPATYTALECLRHEHSTWKTLAKALKPKNRERFKQALAEERKVQMGEI